MSDKEKPKEAAKEAKPEGGEAPAKKKPPIKLLGIVAVAMIAEAGGVYVIAGMSGKEPPTAKAELKEGEGKAADTTVEVPLIEEKFQNMQTGRVWLWDVQVFLRVKAKYEKDVQKKLEEHQAELQEMIATEFRKATMTQLKEPGLENINRRLLKVVDEVVGKDKEGESKVEKILIPRCRGFPAD